MEPHQRTALLVSLWMGTTFLETVPEDGRYNLSVFLFLVLSPNPAPLLYEIEWVFSEGLDHRQDRAKRVRHHHVSHAVRTLEARGIVTLSDHPDPAYKIVTVTEAGQALAERMASRSWR